MQMNQALFLFGGLTDSVLPLTSVGFSGGGWGWGVVL